MRKVELSLASDYVPSWGIVDAVRELFQNALDQETQCPDNKASWSYDAKNQTLSICNKKSSLTTKSLLLGSTSKAGDTNTIGQFGEGYKVATLVLLRNDKPVVFYNAGESQIWRPRFVKSRRFSANVLTFFIEDEVNWTDGSGDDLEIKIHKVSEQEWNEFIVPSNLRLRTDYTVIEETEYGQILDIPGKVFVNGLFVCNYKDYRHSYNFKPGQLKLDRDRKLASDFDLKWLASKMWKSTSSEEARDIVVNLLKEGCADVQYIADVSWYSAKPIAIKAHTEFVAQHGSNAVPVSTQAEADKVPITHKPIIVNETYKRIITESPTYVAPAPKKTKKKPFTITCNSCGSDDVTVKHLSDVEGSQIVCEGYLIECNDCGASTTDNEQEVEIDE